jgi:hypothetical protein
LWHGRSIAVPLSAVRYGLVSISEVTSSAGSLTRRELATGLFVVTFLLARCSSGIYFYSIAIFSILGTAGHYFYINSVRMFVICLHLVPSCFFYDQKLCSMQQLSVALATGLTLLSLRIIQLY